MKDKYGERIKSGNIVMFMDRTSRWMKLLFLGGGKFYVLDSYNFHKDTQHIIDLLIPMNLNIIGDKIETPWLMFATYDKSRNENLEYSIKIKEEK